MAKVSKNVKRKQVLRSRTANRSAKKKEDLSDRIYLAGDVVSEAFFMACVRNDVKVAKQLLMQGANVKHGDFGALYVAAGLGTNGGIAKLIRPFMTKQDWMDMRLAESVFKRDIVSIESLLAQGAQPGRWYGSLLVHAAEDGCSSIVKTLLEHGLDPSITGVSAVAAAVKNNHRACLDVFIDHMSKDFDEMWIKYPSWEIQDPIEKLGFDYMVSKVGALNASKVLNEQTPEATLNRARRL